MLKKILIAVGLLLLLIVGGIVFYFDSLLKSGIEVVGSEVLGTSITVASVSVSPLSGSGTISGLSIGNPEGFNSDYAMQLDQVSVNIDAGSVFSDVVVIESVTIVQPEITYETRITTDNIRALLENLAGGSSSGDPAAADTSAGKRVIIRELQILDPQLNLVAAIVTAPIPLPDIELRDIGAEDDSATVAEAMQTVLSAISTSILSANLPSVDQLTDSIEEGINQVEDAVDDTVEELGNRLRSILN